MALMEQTGEPSDEAELDNPVGGIKRGWAEIRPVYERIFHSKTPVRVEFYDYTLHEFVDIFYVVGRERPLGGDSELRVAIRTKPSMETVTRSRGRVAQVCGMGRKALVTTWT
jgi:hypothetical protein